MSVAKWIHLPALLDQGEMEALLAALEGARIFSASCVVELGKEEISHADFLEGYGAYVDALRGGCVPDMAPFRPLFSTLWTVKPEELLFASSDGCRGVVRPTQPVLQLQLHQLGYSPLDGKFRSMVFGDSSISWGIQFSYPGIYQDPQTMRSCKVDESFSNTHLFRQLQRWMRRHTVATPFEVEGQKVNVPIRLGKSCFSWINDHPQLIEQNLRVCNAS